MAWRFRCTLRFAPGSGMATWGAAQLQVRLTHDHDPNRQAANEEASAIATDIVTGGPTALRRETLEADLFLATEALAIDTFNTFTTGAVTARLRPDANREESFVDIHECFHDGEPSPCAVLQRWPAP